MTSESQGTSKPGRKLNYFSEALGIRFLKVDSQSRITLSSYLRGVLYWVNSRRRTDCAAILRAGGGLHIDGRDGTLTSKLREVARAVSTAKRSHSKDAGFNTLKGVLDVGATWECTIAPDGKLAIPESAQSAGKLEVKKGDCIGVVARVDLIDLIPQEDLVEELQEIMHRGKTPLGHSTKQRK